MPCLVCSALPLPLSLCRLLAGERDVLVAVNVRQVRECTHDAAKGEPPSSTPTAMMSSGDKTTIPVNSSRFVSSIPRRNAVKRDSSSVSSPGSHEGPDGDADHVD